MEDIFTTSKCLSSNQIKKYLNEELKDDHLYQIENHLLDCELCSTAIEGYISYTASFDETILEEIQKDITGKLQKEKKARSEKKIRNINPRFTLNQIAAAVLFLIVSVAGLVYWSSNENENLFTTYFESYESEAFIALRGGDAKPTELDADYKKALELFITKDYKKSIPLFVSYIKNDPENSVAYFHLGLAYLENGEIENAIEQLTICRYNSVKKYEDATWYLIMANLKKENFTEANSLLEDLLKKEKGYYYKELVALKKKLADKNKALE